MERIPYRVITKEFDVTCAVKKLRNISALSEFAIAFSENVWYTVVDEKFNGKRG